MLIHRVIDYLDDARAYVSKRALHKRENDELWALHFHWDEYKAELCSQLLSQTFVFSSIREDTLPSHQVVRSLHCVDQLVQKALALALVDVLPRSPLCFSYIEHGGVASALEYLSQYSASRFGFKTDVVNYTGSIGHLCLLDKLSAYVDESTLWLVYQALSLHRTGLPEGGPLSHVLGNFYLHDLDVIFEGRTQTQHYCRYMDDILVLTSTSGALRLASRTIKHHFKLLELNTATTKPWAGGMPTLYRLKTFLGQPVWATLLHERDKYTLEK